MADRVSQIMDAVRRQGAVQRESPVEDAPHHGTVYRREPVYEPTITIAYPDDAQRVHFPTPDTHGTDKVEPPVQHEAGYRIAYPQRKEINVGRFRVAKSVTLDGTGAGTAEIVTVPNNQTWLIDRVVARGGAAGDALLYAGSATNDQDLYAVLHLTANSFSQQVDGNPVEVGPGLRLQVVFIGAGNNLTGTVVVFYRLVELVPGRTEETTP